MVVYHGLGGTFLSPKTTNTRNLHPPPSCCIDNLASRCIVSQRLPSIFYWFQIYLFEDLRMKRFLSLAAIVLVLMVAVIGCQQAPKALKVASIRCTSNRSRGLLNARTY